MSKQRKQTERGVEMKKILSTILLIVMCLSLCACGSKTDKINEALQGKWAAVWQVGDNVIGRYYIFKDNTYMTARVTANAGASEHESGTYEITDSVIQFLPDDGSEGKDLEYSYNEDTGEITLWWSDGIEFEKTEE